jgi:hypothetical protein
MKAATLAIAIQRDLLRTEPAKTETSTCFACGRPFSPRPGIGDDNTHRFRSPRCREAFDNGFPPYESRPKLTNEPWRVVAGPPDADPGYLAPILPKGTHGFFVQCAGCGKTFDSTGLRCCSTGCERRHRERSENAEVMAKVGIEPPVKPKCEAPGCGRDIPNWRNGRRVSKATRFCSIRCKQAAYAKKAAKVGDGPDDDS